MQQNLAQFLPQIEIDEDAFDNDDSFFDFWGQKTGRDDLWLGKTVPRYTSYPPATVFEDGISVSSYRSELAKVTPEEPLSLYMHLPYCKAMCLYCGCHTCATQKQDEVSDYLSYVHKELEEVALSAPRQRHVNQIHLGGGSPNMMSEKDLGLFFGALARRFDMSGCKEVAVELDPRLITKAQARTMRMMGVNRVSLGVQDFDPDVQQAIGRVQPLDLIHEACETLRTAGIEKINFDLIYGLPLQTPSSMARTAKLTAALGPDRVSLFSYAHVPQVKKHQRALEKYRMPGTHATLAMESIARNVLLDFGYEAIGLDHFAHRDDVMAKAYKAGTLQRNFQGYTTDTAGALVGVGASSIGQLSGGFFQNIKDIAEYKQKVREDGLAVTRGYMVSGEDRFRSAIIQSLMCDLKVNLETICHQYNYSLASLSSELEQLKPFEESGIIEREGYKIRLAIPQRQAIRVVASIFDQYERTLQTPVSRAV